MNDPKVVALLEQAQKAAACSPRLAPYVAKAAKNELQFSDISQEDAVWLLAVLKKSPSRDALKQIAKEKAALADAW